MASHTDLRDFVICIQKTTRNYKPNETENNYSEKPRLQLSVNSPDRNTRHNGLQFKSTLGNAIEHFEDELSQYTRRLINEPTYLEPLGSNPTNWGHIFLTQTIEGQRIVERIIADHTNWTKSVDLPHLKQSSENITTTKELIFHNAIERSDNDKWTQTTDELEQHVEDIDPLEDINLNNLNIRSDNHSYIIRLLDDNWNHHLYIGKSTNIIQKLQKQVRQGGTFTEANRTRMEVITVEKLVCGNKKNSLHTKAINNYDIPERRIHGVRNT